MKRKEITYELNNNGCWVCTSHCKNKRILRTWISHKHKLIHRLVLEEKLGRELLPNMCACHLCDNPSCINPDHLEEHTIAWNNKDRDNKGRLVLSPNSGIPKIYFKATRLSDGYEKISNNQVNFAIKYNLSNANISSCLHNKLKQTKGWIFNYL